jgi:xanthine dehydrogenase accessory factor
MGSGADLWRYRARLCRAIIVKAATLRALNQARDAKRAVVLATWLDTGEERLIELDGPVEEAISAAVAEAFAHDRSTTVVVDGRDLFLNVFNPPLRLVIIGAVHVAQPLSALAQISGYDVTIVDPRRAWSDPARFPGIRVLNTWPDDALKTLELDHRTAVATLTHDPKIDDPALHVALRTPVFYVGSLGSRRTHAKRLKRLHEAGFSNAETDRINAPVGLDIGARTHAEIALSVMAEVVAAQRGKL